MSIELPPGVSLPLSPPPGATTRASPSPGGATFQSRLSQGLSLASKVVSAAGPVVPGAGLVSVALGGLSRLFGGAQGPGSASGAALAEGSGAESLLSGSRSLNLKYLALQESMAREARVYTALSNIMRARHEAAQNAISNIR